MANEIASAREGLASILSGIRGLRVFDRPQPVVNQLPAAIIAFEARDGLHDSGSVGFSGWLKVTILIVSAGTNDAMAKLEGFLDPSGENSIEAAACADPTWGGRVESGRLVLVDNVGRRKISGFRYFGADLHFEFTMQVTEA